MSSQPMVRVRWQIVTCYVADVPASEAARAGATVDLTGTYEKWLDSLHGRYLSREVGDDGGTIVEIENL